MALVLAEPIVDDDWSNWLSNDIVPDSTMVSLDLFRDVIFNRSIANIICYEKNGTKSIDYIDEVSNEQRVNNNNGHIQYPVDVQYDVSVLLTTTRNQFQVEEVVVGYCTNNCTVLLFLKAQDRAFQRYGFMSVHPSYGNKTHQPIHSFIMRLLL